MILILKPGRPLKVLFKLPTIHPGITSPCTFSATKSGVGRKLGAFKYLEESVWFVISLFVQFRPQNLIYRKLKNICQVIQMRPQPNTTQT